jgi:hypothetical protein
MLPTPDHSDLSAAPSSESEADSDETEMEMASGESDMEAGDETITQDNLASPTLSAAMEELDLRQEQDLYLDNPLHRAISNSSSWYASSEGEGESDGDMGDSFSIPRPPVSGGGWVSISYNDFEAPKQTPKQRQDDKPSFFEYLYGE